MAKFMSASVSIAFLTWFLTKGERYIAHSVCYVYLSHDTGIHDGINCQLIGVGNWRLEHNNTGKSPQKCYSCIDKGMDKLTEHKAKFARARVLTQMSLSDNRSLLQEFYYLLEFYKAKILI